MILEDNIPSAERAPTDVLVADLLSESFSERLSNDEKIVLTRARLTLMQYVVPHLGKTMENLKVSDLAKLEFVRHADGQCFITNTDTKAPTFSVEMSTDMAKSLDALNERIKQRWPNRKDIQLKIQDVDDDGSSARRALDVSSPW